MGVRAFWDMMGEPGGKGTKEETEGEGKGNGVRRKDVLSTQGGHINWSTRSTSRSGIPTHCV